MWRARRQSSRAPVGRLAAAVEGRVGRTRARKAPRTVVGSRDSPGSMCRGPRAPIPQHCCVGMRRFLPLMCRHDAAKLPRSCHSGCHSCAPMRRSCDRQRHTVRRVRWMLAKGYLYSSFDVADARRQRRHEQSRQRMLAARADPDCICCSLRRSSGRHQPQFKYSKGTIWPGSNSNTAGGVRR